MDLTHSGILLGGVNAGPYCSHSSEDAAKFNDYAHAFQFASMGFSPVELPASVASRGEWGLRNANGDWIANLEAWWKHEPRALKSFQAFYRQACKSILRDADFMKDN